MKIYLIRHGETEWNRKGILQGRIDIPLNQYGRGQAFCWAKYFEHTPVEKIISSPLVRAHETARIIARSMDREVLCEDKLIEKDFGRATGMEKEVRELLYPDRKYESMENWQKVIYRTATALNQYAKRYKGNDILIVCHSSVIKALIQFVSKVDDNRRDIYGVTMSALGLTEIECDDRLRFKLNYANKIVIKENNTDG